MLYRAGSTPNGKQASLEVGWGRSSPSKEPEDAEEEPEITYWHGTYGHPSTRRLIILLAGTLVVVIARKKRRAPRPSACS